MSATAHQPLRPRPLRITHDLLSASLGAWRCHAKHLDERPCEDRRSDEDQDADRRADAQVESDEQVVVAKYRYRLRPVGASSQDVDTVEDPKRIQEAEQQR